QGLLRPGYQGTLSWNRGGEPTGSVGYTVTEGTLTLKYKNKAYGDDGWVPVELSVPIVKSPCRYGGRRSYFLCPNLNCQRRCELLYSVGKYFLCRKCAGYLYPSQMGGRLDQLIEAKHKIGKRIFEDYDGDGWRKKKGMHQKTFDRQRDKYQDLDWRIDHEMSVRLGALEGIPRGGYSRAKG
ncbi:unnamed protein product, partial [marine sediment metagenome]